MRWPITTMLSMSSLASVWLPLVYHCSAQNKNSQRFKLLMIQQSWSIMGININSSKVLTKSSKEKLLLMLSHFSRTHYLTQIRIEFAKHQRVLRKRRISQFQKNMTGEKSIQVVFNHLKTLA